MAENEKLIYKQFLSQAIFGMVEIPVPENCPGEDKIKVAIEVKEIKPTDVRGIPVYDTDSDGKLMKTYYYKKMPVVSCVGVEHLSSGKRRRYHLVCNNCLLRTHGEVEIRRI